ncbi:MAG: GPR endopeptidase [Oscillospiraceae bacterium]
MTERRTDLALEARELWQESAEKESQLPGVEAGEREVDNFMVTTVKVLDERGEKALNKPMGKYVTIELGSLCRREDGAFPKGVKVLADELRSMLGLIKKDSVLVAGLGNPDITPDAIGPKTVRNTMATRHLTEKEPEYFGNFRRVSVFESGVLGMTGVESAEMIKAVSDRLRPECVIVVDALASRRMARVCRTVQLADTGIVPGSGVGNSRSAINSETLGTKVIALGVPTVVDAATLAADLVEQAGMQGCKPEELEKFGGDMIVTPREIDSRVSDISKLLGYGINLALHDGLSVEDVDMFLS